LNLFAATKVLFRIFSILQRRSVDTLSQSDLRHYIISCVALSEDDVKKGKQSFVSVAGSWLNVTSSNVINGNVHVKSVSITANSTIVVVDSLLDIPDDQRNSLDNVSSFSLIFESFHVFGINSSLRCCSLKCSEA
jgi:hypothetical protein